MAVIDTDAIIKVLLKAVLPEFQGRGFLVSSARQCTDALFGRCFRVLGEVNDPYVTLSTLIALI
jgi:hypothetical protein